MAPEQNLNEQVEEVIDDATVITVPIDDTLSNSGEAADAKAVGDALALKADKSELQMAVKVNNQPADAQGLILIDGTNIQVSDQEEETLAEAVTDLKGKTAENIPMSSDSGAKTIAEVVNANTEAIESMEEMTGATMPIESGSQTTVKAAIEARVKTVNRKVPDADGDVDLSVVPLAENLQSDKMESIEGAFIIRTTGGNASISDGKAYPLHLFGSADHAGYVAEELNMTVIPIARTEPDEPITATIDRDTFVAYVEESGTINLYYTTEWSADPELYGITVTGTPVAGDQITVEYVKEVRGTITVANPARLVGTGWNLFDYNNGYAHVVKYSTEYGYKIGGSYTSIQFSETLTGERTGITPSANGLFNVPSDGYVFVTGGNNTDTYILATWSDWKDGPATGYWESYRESGIDLSAVMTTYFPNGLLAVGTIRDEIDLSAKRSISRIERLAYSEENRAAAAATGRSYDFDQNYIYIARESAVLSAITVDTIYTVSEHGLEWFTETALPVITEILYGKNLRDKLERDVLTISAQTLTEEEKAQARTNIGAMSQDDGDKKLVAPTTAGTAGQLLRLKADGGTEWNTQGTPTDEQVGTAVSTWLDAHPEATTTVQDGAISRAKLNDDLKAKTDAVPELKSALGYIETLDNVPSDMCVTPIVSYANGFINTSGAVTSNSKYKYARYDILPTTKSILIHRIYIAGSTASYNVVSAYKNDGTYISGLTNVAAGGTGAFKTYVQFEIPIGTAYILVTSGNMSSSSTFYNVYQIGYYTFVKNERVINIIPMSTFVEQLYFYVPVSSLESTEYFTLDMELEIDSTRQVASYDVYMCGYNEEMTTRTLGLYRTSLTRFISGNKINLHQNMWDGTKDFSSCYYVGFIINLNYTAPSNSNANLGVQTAVNYTVKTSYAYINDVAVTDVGYPEATLISQVNVAENEPYNPMYGGRLCTIGDSLTAVYYKTEAESWPYLIAKWNNMSLDNLGESGRPLAYSEDYSGTCMAEMVDSLNRMKYYTHIFVMGGANDYNYLIPIGNNTDTEITTFKGAVNHMISKLTELYPCARIVFATTYQRTSGKADKPYADAMLEVCNLRGIPCLNNYQASGVQMTSSNWMAVYGADGTTGNKHLNAAGDLFVAPRFESALKYLQGNVQPETKQEYISPDVFFTSKIASLNFTNTSNGRRMDVVGNKITQTKVGSGSTYGFYSLVGKYYFMSGDATSLGGMDAVVKSMYTNEAYYGFTDNLLSTNYEWLYKQYVYDPKGMSPQIIIATYDPVNDVVLSRTLTTTRIAHMTNEFINAVNTNKNLIVMFYRRLSGDASNGESVEIVWSLEAVEGAT